MTETFAPVITGVVVMVPQARAITPHAHITLLAPFGRESTPTSGELDEVARFFAEQAPFAFRLTDVCTFPSGIRYLSPEPAARFSRLTQGLHRLFPEYPPYRGEFDIVVPHLTIPEDAVVGPLPLAGHLREATLLHSDHGDVTELASFPLGASVA
ncbi:MAG TPA: 2'-5' RNA ligase family protein [Marmoricola sp.]|nr:2'-5' RNA ligase family protein [Marmoricola sp.]